MHTWAHISRAWSLTNRGAVKWCLAQSGWHGAVASLTCKTTLGAVTSHRQPSRPAYTTISFVTDHPSSATVQPDINTSCVTAHVRFTHSPAVSWPVVLSIEANVKASALGLEKTGKQRRRRQHSLRPSPQHLSSPLNFKVDFTCGATAGRPGRRRLGAAGRKRGRRTMRTGRKQTRGVG